MSFLISLFALVKRKNLCDIEQLFVPCTSQMPFFASVILRLNVRCCYMCYKLSVFKSITWQCQSVSVLFLDLSLARFSDFNFFSSSMFCKLKCWQSVNTGNRFDVCLQGEINTAEQFMERKVTNCRTCMIRAVTLHILKQPHLLSRTAFHHFPRKRLEVIQ